MSLTLTFCGAAETVTGSMHLVSTGPESYLLDCGMFQGHRQEAFERNSHLPFNPHEIRAVVLSHAHIDHSGNLPFLAKSDFNGAIYSTPATAELCRYMLADSAFLQEKDAAYLEKRHERRKAIGMPGGSQAVPPLYAIEDAQKAIGQFKARSLREPFEIGPRVTASFTNAGHILGSASVLLEHNNTRLLFSGDLGRPAVPILHPPDPAPAADYLIIESTYGDRIHQPIASVADKLARLVTQTVARGGHVIVPAFAVGRTQELVLTLHHLVEERRIPEIPIFVDSPLAINVTDVFRNHPEEYSADPQSFLEAGQDPFGFRGLRYLREVSESKALNDLRSPYVVISASGMCEGGRIVHHLRNGIEDERNLVLITGYQAEHTLGRRIVERQAQVSLFGELLNLRAEVAVLNELSAHADQHDLVNWIRPVASSLKGVFLVHGEPRAQKALAVVIKEQLGIEAKIPRQGESTQL